MYTCSDNSPTCSAGSSPICSPAMPPVLSGKGEATDLEVPKMMLDSDDDDESLGEAKQGAAEEKQLAEMPDSSDSE
jgi:hypothetical protein